MMTNVYAADSPVAQPMSGQTGFMNFVPLLVIFAIFYFLLIRPQQKKAKEHEKMLNNLNRGDRVMTSGGIYGVITALRGKVVEIKITEEVKIQVARSAVSTIVAENISSPDESAPAEVKDAEVVSK